MEDISLKIRQIIIDKLGVHELQLTDNVEFYDDLGIDSLDFCELILSIEKSFNIVIEDDFYGKLKTIGALIKFVDQKVRVTQPVQPVQYANAG